MNESLLKWIVDADAVRHLDQFGIQETPIVFAYQRSRKDDLYIALVGELFERMKDGYGDAVDWARLGNALAQYAAIDRHSNISQFGVIPEEAALYASAAFYLGGFPASAYLTVRNAGAVTEAEHTNACVDLLGKRFNSRSNLFRGLLDALLRGEMETIAAAEIHISDAAVIALNEGPEAWIPLRLLQSLLSVFQRTNLRQVLPSGDSSFWTPLVNSFVRRGTWDFFPSQIAAIRRGLLDRTDTFSLQMPTGAGKTALCETLLYSHLQQNPTAAAVLLVPYRSLASELRQTVVKRLNDMNISARCAYGGTVPSGDEVRAFDETRALIATPETLSGILSANPAFAAKISLVICDEGHLLDAPSRGIGLELLLARMKIRPSGSQRFVFVSAIVPNIEEVNAWLGGTDETVVRSDYRPAIAEFSVMRAVGRGAAAVLDLEMHPHEEEPIRYRIERFLRQHDFVFRNSKTGRNNTYPYSTYSARAIAAARKSLPMGAAVVFCANKGGGQGAIGLAGELLEQLAYSLPLPSPATYMNRVSVDITAEYLQNEYGEQWIGTRTLRGGAVLHHGDIPQESREVVERLLREGSVRMGICTSTLAEGVNLPIRTLVLYSVQRIEKSGNRQVMLTRDIKNLVGRAGRAGATTKGLVICANADQWPAISPVALQATGEDVVGALRTLIERVSLSLALQNVVITNEVLEATVGVDPIIDGIDATLVDLAATEIGDDELLRIAVQLADETFAARQTDAGSKQLLRSIFRLRGERISAFRTQGRLSWIRETGARPRMVDVVEQQLLPMRANWNDFQSAIDPALVQVVLAWVWTQREIQQAIREAFRLKPTVELQSVRGPFFTAVQRWVNGESFPRIADGAQLSIDATLGLHSQVLTFKLQTAAEQALAVLGRLLQSQDKELSEVAFQFPEHLRFGVPTVAGRTLASGGVRHRRAYIMLGREVEPLSLPLEDRFTVFVAAQDLIRQETPRWRAQLGALVFKNTLDDLSAVTRNTL